VKNKINTRDGFLDSVVITDIAADKLYIIYYIVEIFFLAEIVLCLALTISKCL